MPYNPDYAADRIVREFERVYRVKLTPELCSELVKEFRRAYAMGAWEWALGSGRPGPVPSPLARVADYRCQGEEPRSYESGDGL